MSLVEIVERLLTSYGVDTGKFGQGTAKTLSQLLKEIEDKESTLDIINGQIVRSVSVISAILKRRDGKVLVEQSQHFYPTATREEYYRSRLMPLCEKIKSNEDVHSALKRALDEELGIKLVEVNLITCSTIIEESYSNSYPGLLTRYIVHNCLCEITEERDEFDYTEYFSDGQRRVTASWKFYSIDDIRNLSNQYNKNLTTVGL